MNIRPCIDLHEGKVKQIVGSTLNNGNDSLKENFISLKDSAYYANLYKSDNLPGGHIIKLGPGNDEATKIALSSYPMGMQVGGGMTLDNCKEFLDLGASHIIVTSYIFRQGQIDFDRLKKLVNLIGKDKLVLDLSCRKKNDQYYVVTERWKNFTNYTINTSNIKKLEKFASEFLVHAADIEGLCKGVDGDLISLLADTVSIPTVYAGGVSDFTDLDKVKLIGKNRIDLTIGSALDIFGGNLSYKNVVTWNYENSGL